MEAGQVIQAFAQQLFVRGYAQATITLYRHGLAAFLAYLDSQHIHDLRQVSKAVIVAYQALVLAQDNCQETKALKLRPVKRLFEFLCSSNQLLLNPTEGLIETCRKHRKTGPVLTQAEVARLLAQPNPRFAMAVRDKAIMALFYSTGIRLNELLQLELADLDLADGSIRVRHGKGGKERVLPLGSTSRAALCAYLERVRRNQEEQRLFLKANGQPMSASLVRQAIRACQRKAGIITPASPHSLRRSCATHLVQQGADIRFVQELLGHARVSTTQVYTKVAISEVKESHNRYHPQLIPCAWKQA